MSKKDISTPKESKLSSNKAERIVKAKLLREKYPGKVPIIIEKYASKNNELTQKLPSLEKNNYVFESDKTLSHLLAKMRERLSLTPEEGMIICIIDDKGESHFPSMTKTIKELYHEFGESGDGFLYIKYLKENTFG